jgi:hypothetical protein
MSHDPKAHSRGRSLLIRHSGTVILHGEDAPVADSGERHDEASGLPVADRVVDRLLSDSIEVNGSKIVESRASPDLKRHSTPKCSRVLAANSSNATQRLSVPERTSVSPRAISRAMVMPSSIIFTTCPASTAAEPAILSSSTFAANAVAAKC